MDNEIFMYRKVCETLQSILNHAEFKVETFNESVLVNYMEMLGYPINYDSTTRNIGKDWLTHCEEQSLNNKRGDFE